jgi:hypothetical protein
MPFCDFGQDFSTVSNKSCIPVFETLSDLSQQIRVFQALKHDLTVGILCAVSHL